MAWPFFAGYRHRVTRSGVEALLLDLTPIQTKFDGILFRSRTEARWAVFFKTLGLAYQYESEGYDIGGTWYLPDFYIPEWERFIEVKPYGKPLDEAVALIVGLEKVVRKAAAVLAGNPSPGRYQVWVPSFEGDGSLWGPSLLGDCRRCSTGVWSFSDTGYGSFGGCSDGCSNEKSPGGDSHGRVGEALMTAGSFRFSSQETESPEAQKLNAILDQLREIVERNSSSNF